MLTITAMLQLGFLVSLVGALLLAAALDLTRYTIPNRLVVAIAASFPPAALLSTQPVDWLGHLGAGALVLAVGAILLRAGMLGGGDVKLWSAAALWAGFGALLYQTTWIALSGGALGMIVLAARLAASRYATAFGATKESIPAILRPRAAIPYGVAIAAGAILSLPTIAELDSLRSLLN